MPSVSSDEEWRRMPTVSSDAEYLRTPSVSTDAEWRRTIARQSPPVYAPTHHFHRVRRVFGFGPCLSTIDEEDEGRSNVDSGENDMKCSHPRLDSDSECLAPKGTSRTGCLRWALLLAILAIFFIILPVIGLTIGLYFNSMDSIPAPPNCAQGTCQVQGAANGQSKLAAIENPTRTLAWNSYRGPASTSQLSNPVMASVTPFNGTMTIATLTETAALTKRNLLRRKHLPTLTIGSATFAIPDLLFSNVDPCTVLAAYDSVPIPIQVLRMCLHNSPYNKTRAYNTVQSIINALQFYVFLDTIKTRSPLALPDDLVNRTILPNQPFDIIADLTKIQNTTFQTDYLFDSALTTIIKRLRDGHTQYTSCYDVPFVYVAPFPLVNVVENIDGTLKQRVKISSSITSMTSSQLQAFYWSQGLNIADWAGSEVLYIDDQPVLLYLRFWAEFNIALSQDPSADFNSLFVSTMNAASGWAYSVGDFTLRFRLPPKDQISYVVRKPNNETWKIIAPYYVKVASLIAAPFNDTRTFWNAICSPKQITTSGSTTSLVSQRPSIARRTLLVPAEKAGVYLNVATFAENGMSVYVLPSNSTKTVGILAVRDFLPASADLNGQFEYLTSFLRALAALKAQNVTKIIISLTQNPGGIGCIASYITQYIFGTKYYAPMSNFRYSPLLSNLATYFSSSNVTLSTPSQLDMTQFNAPITPYNTISNLYDFSAPTSLSFSGAQSASYTNFIRDNCPLPDAQHNALIQNATRYNPADFLILTDGQCFSACANFVDQLSKGYGVKVVGYGGILGNPMRGGNSFAVVNSLNAIVGEIISAGFHNDSNAPRFLDTTSQFTVAVRQLFPANADLTTGANMDLPSQFEFTPVDYRILPDEKMASDIRYVWQKVARFF